MFTFIENAFFPSIVSNCFVLLVCLKRTICRQSISYLLRAPWRLDYSVKLVACEIICAEIAKRSVCNLNEGVSINSIKHLKCA